MLAIIHHTPGSFYWASCYFSDAKAIHSAHAKDCSKPTTREPCLVRISGTLLLRDLPILICISLTLAGLALKFHAVWVGPVRTLVDMFTPMSLLAHIRGLMVNRILMESLEHGGRFEPTLRTLLEQADPWLSSRLHPLHSRIMAGHHISVALQLMPWKMVPQNLIDIWAVTSSEHLDLMRDTQNEWETSLLTKLEYAVAWLRTAMLIAAASLLGSTAWILHVIQTSLR